MQSDHEISKNGHNGNSKFRKWSYFQFQSIHSKFFLADYKAYVFWRSALISIRPVPVDLEWLHDF